MKIAISGAQNTGKTTFATALANAMKLPLIAERFETITRTIPPGMPGTDDALAMLFQKLYLHKHQQEMEEDNGFISDRCTIDLFHYWTTFPELRAHRDTPDLYEKCRRDAAVYDYVVFLPWGTVTYSNIDEALDQWRRSEGMQMNPWENLARHSAMIGLALTWLDARKVVIVPESIIDNNERVHWLRALLDE